MTNQHEWQKSTLGHGETMCKHCFITNREAAVLECLNECDAAPDVERDFADQEIDPEMGCRCLTAEQEKTMAGAYLENAVERIPTQVSEFHLRLELMKWANSKGSAGTRQDKDGVWWIIAPAQ